MSLENNDERIIQFHLFLGGILCLSCIQTSIDMHQVTK